MKSTIVILPLFLFVLFSACEESFSPKGKTEAKYAVYCILDANTSMQKAVVTRLYNVDGFDPYVNDEDVTVSGCIVNVTYDGMDYAFDETLVDEAGALELLPSVIYQNNNLLPDGISEQLTIEVSVPDGKVIRGSTSTPARFDFDFGQSDRLFPLEGDSINIYWYKYVTDNYYAPRAFIEYYIEDDDGNFTRHTEPIIPHPYFRLPDGRAKPSSNDHIIYRSRDINNSMLSLSGNEVFKSRFYIVGIKVEVLVFESDLAAYYVTSNPSQNQYIVIIDAVDYSNLDDGLGIFGVYRKHTWDVNLDEEYVESFGYNVWE